MTVASIVMAKPTIGKPLLFNIPWSENVLLAQDCLEHQQDMDKLLLPTIPPACSSTSPDELHRASFAMCSDRSWARCTDVWDDHCVI